MEKSPDAFRTISEVADWLGVPTHVLRFWESRFSQIKPVKRAGGRRYYRPNDMLLIGGIKRLLHDDGMTIRGVQKLLREEGVKHVAGFSQPLDAGPMIDVTPEEEPVAPAPMAENVPAAPADNVVSLVQDAPARPEAAEAEDAAPELAFLRRTTGDGEAEEKPEAAPDTQPDLFTSRRRTPAPAQQPAPEPQREPAAAAPSIPATPDVPETDADDDAPHIVARPGLAARLRVGGLSGDHDVVARAVARLKDLRATG